MWGRDRPRSEPGPTAVPASADGGRLLRIFAAVAVIEALTWAGLLFGMYLKYVTHTTELGVRIFGSLHGAVFICYVAVVLTLIARRQWPIRWTGLLALAASVPPFMTVLFEVLARRRGLLGGR